MTSLSNINKFLPCYRRQPSKSDRWQSQSRCQTPTSSRVAERWYRYRCFRAMRRGSRSVWCREQELPVGRRSSGWTWRAPFQMDKRRLDHWEWSGTGGCNHHCPQNNHRLHLKQQGGKFWWGTQAWWCEHKMRSYEPLKFHVILFSGERLKRATERKRNVSQEQQPREGRFSVRLSIVTVF